jgi:hypothetical protein
MNYPGVAAQPRPSASAKFREVDPTRGFGLSPNVLDINGSNTYQFVMSNPVGRTDSTGPTDGGQVLNWPTDTYHEATPAGDFIDAIGTTPAEKFWLAAYHYNTGGWGQAGAGNDPIQRAKSASLPGYNYANKLLTKLDMIPLS